MSQFILLCTVLSHYIVNMINRLGKGGESENGVKSIFGFFLPNPQPLDRRLYCVYCIQYKDLKNLWNDFHK